MLSEEEQEKKCGQCSRGDSSKGQGAVSTSTQNTAYFSERQSVKLSYSARRQ